MATLATHTYLPTTRGDFDAVLDVLQADRVELSSEARTVVLSGELREVLVHAATALSHDKAVHVTPADRQLTTQQAADLLGVSRPTLVAIIDRGELPCERISSHRRIRMDDLLAYRARRREAQLAALDALSDDDELSTDAMIAEAREARKAVAARRKTRGLER